MKNVVFVLVIMMAINLQAQKGSYYKKSDLTSEQIATMRTKQITLALDLNEVQQKEVLTFNLKNAKNFSKIRGERKELTEEERFEMKNKMLDNQIANQREMKKILNDVQYERWRKMQKSRMNKMNDSRKSKSKREHMHKKG